jgi:hypothetical protein
LSKVLRLAIVVALSLAYLSYVFRLFDPLSWRSGLGDWQDPYFINALLEHWYRSVTRLADPSSPPMYFPARGTLGYSHGLVLFAPFYVPLRLFLHPFHAHTFALFLAIEAGALCLYALARKLGLSFVEALVATAFFVTSRNVVHGETGVWLQRASVFLVPPILLLALASARMRPGGKRLALAAFAGLLSTLLYVQDFYTAHFTFLFAGVFAVAWTLVDGRLVQRAAVSWRSASTRARVAVVLIALVTMWAGVVVLSGGGEVVVLGLKLRSHDWVRPALAALLGSGALIASSADARASIRDHPWTPWLLAFVTGAAAGAALFLWMYLDSYREHRGFPEQNLVSATLARDSLLAAIGGLDGFTALRSFVLVSVAGTIAWVPWFGIETRTRIYCACAVAVSLLVLLIPFRFPGWSIWNAVIRPLPGFGVIRDPRRIIQVFELAVALGLILFVRRLPARSLARLSTIALALGLLILRPNPERFDYERLIAPYDQWVAAPIAIDPACTSFYIKGASAEYISRGRDMWSLYNVDAMFVALNHGLPTLNGYSAWFPRGWALHNPADPEYAQRVTRWMEMNHLNGVCELDMDARTMTRARRPG